MARKHTGDATNSLQLHSTKMFGTTKRRCATAALNTPSSKRIKIPRTTIFPRLIHQIQIATPEGDKPAMALFDTGANIFVLDNTWASSGKKPPLVQDPRWPWSLRPPWTTLPLYVARLALCFASRRRENLQMHGRLCVC